MIDGRTLIPKKDMIQLAKRCFNKHGYYASGNNVRCGDKYMYNTKNYVTYIYFDKDEYSLDKAKKYKAVLFTMYHEKHIRMTYGYIFFKEEDRYHDTLGNYVDDGDWSFVGEEDVSDSYLENINNTTKSVAIKLSEEQYDLLVSKAKKNKAGISEYAKTLLLDGLK